MSSWSEATTMNKIFCKSIHRWWCWEKHEDREEKIHVQSKYLPVRRIALSRRKCSSMIDLSPRGWLFTPGNSAISGVLCWSLLLAITIADLTNESLQCRAMHNLCFRHHEPLGKDRNDWRKWLEKGCGILVS